MSYVVDWLPLLSLVFQRIKKIFGTKQTTHNVNDVISFILTLNGTLMQAIPRRTNYLHYLELRPSMLLLYCPMPIHQEKKMGKKKCESYGLLHQTTTYCI
jgi:hypothetical protein